MILERERKIYLRFSNTDIKKFKKLPKNIDILTYSFPCQDLSQQGKQKGISKDTRSGLLYEIERILKNNKDRLPKVLLLENVKALTTKKFIKDFENWIKILNELGYVTKWKVLNSSDYNSFQNRERVFAISYLNKNSNFEFPNKIINNKDLSQLININNEGKELSNLLSYKKTEFYKTNKGIFKSKFINYSKFNSEAYLYLPKGLGPTLTASGANSRLKFYFESEQIIKTMDELEAYQYMGFNLDDAIAVKSTKLLSREKMIFTCGNSISVEVLEALFEEIIKKCL
ncbi:CpG DNA methylase [Mycoplasmopsis arginini]|uniref:DNA (cytosine-5-)-methyltransferase n=1 Tax=Mycoplasmopsis arginini TaxID=2094 RepID=UPI000D621138|nr:DNA (cytosine-5-)-methyltransferase [Mycoplasmopsis arginini]PWC09141.1 CpG DNA methylase [Mycoplasmopsis arginini]